MGIWSAITSCLSLAPIFVTLVMVVVVKFVVVISVVNVFDVVVTVDFVCRRFHCELLLWSLV